jgi:Arc/MetJ family transcription regulator
MRCLAGVCEARRFVACAGLSASGAAYRCVVGRDQAELPDRTRVGSALSASHRPHRLVDRNARTGVSRVFHGVYPVGVVKRTNINLDMDLVDQAAHELGTQRTTDTVHQALREVIARARRARLAQRDFEDLTPEALESIRRPVGRTT